MSSASRVSAGAVLTGVTSLPGSGRCGRRFSSLAGRFLGSEFDSIPRLRHFPARTRHPAKSVHMSEKRLMVLQAMDQCALLGVAPRSGNHRVTAGIGVVGEVWRSQQHRAVMAVVL